jgi:hypothetical protein
LIRSNHLNLVWKLLRVSGRKNMGKVKTRAIVFDDYHVIRNLIYDILKDPGYEDHGTSEYLFLRR